MLHVLFIYAIIQSHTSSPSQQQKDSLYSNRTTDIHNSGMTFINTDNWKGYWRNYPILGARMTTPLEFTHTHTRSHRKSFVVGVPSSNTIAFTRVFSVSILLSASPPVSPTSSGHELFPVFSIQLFSSSSWLHSSHPLIIQKFARIIWNQKQIFKIKIKMEPTYLGSLTLLDDMSSEAEKTWCIYSNGEMKDMRSVGLKFVHSAVGVVRFLHTIFKVQRDLSEKSKSPLLLISTMPRQNGLFCWLSIFMLIISYII